MKNYPGVGQNAQPLQQMAEYIATDSQIEYNGQLTASYLFRRLIRKPAG